MHTARAVDHFDQLLRAAEHNGVNECSHLSIANAPSSASGSAARRESAARAVDLDPWKSGLRFRAASFEIARESGNPVVVGMAIAPKRSRLTYRS